MGNMDIVQSLSPFPGFGSTGRICGAVSGGLIVLGLYFGSNDMLDYEGNSATMTAARIFLPRFEEKVGSLCLKSSQRSNRHHFD